MAETREVRVEADGARLAGTLALSGQPEPQPGIILLHGSGWGERRFYEAFVELFTRAGIATLTFDRRGSGESTGDPAMDIERWAGDAVTVYDVLREQPEIDATRTALWGYSNGAWVATLAASKAPDLAALVLTGTSAVSPARAETYRRVEDLRARGIGEATLEAIREAWTLIFECTAEGLWDEERKRSLESARAVIESDRDLARLPVPNFVQANPRLSSIPLFDQPPLNSDLAPAAGTLPGMAFEPLPCFAAIRCPVLVVLAEDDANAAPRESLELYRRVAAARTPGTFDVALLEGSPHTFTRKPRADDELGRVLGLEEFRPDYLDTMSSWLQTHLQA